MAVGLSGPQNRRDPDGGSGGFDAPFPPPTHGVSGTALGRLAELACALEVAPFAAPDKTCLAELGLSAPLLATAVRVGILIRLAKGVYLRPDALGLAERLIATLPEPFTVAQVRTALGTTRRVALSLLELLDARGVTERLDARRRIRRKDRP